MDRNRSIEAYSFFYRHAGEVRLIMFYANANVSSTMIYSTPPLFVLVPRDHISLKYPWHVFSLNFQKLATSYAPSPQPHTPMYSIPPPAAAYQTYPPHSAAYPPTPYPPPQPTAYPPVYPPASAYPPMSYPPLSAYPPLSYPPPTQDYTCPPGDCSYNT